jgi:hypothetical protein
MKTTIDIPDSLYREAKIRAVEERTSLKAILLRGLEREIRAEPVIAPAEKSYWANRKLRPGYAAALKAGAFSGGTDSTTVISEDRSGRDESIAL